MHNISSKVEPKWTGLYLKHLVLDNFTELIFYLALGSKTTYFRISKNCMVRLLNVITSSLILVCLCLKNMMKLKTNCEAVKPILLFSLSFISFISLFFLCFILFFNINRVFRILQKIILFYDVAWTTAYLLTLEHTCKLIPQTFYKTGQWAWRFHHVTIF